MPGTPFGHTGDGRPATLYTLANATLRVRVTDYGGRIVSIEAPDRDGRRGEVLLGFDTVAEYERAPGAFGALLGRNANRIAGGKLPIDGAVYDLPTNDRGNTLHGGPHGFDMVYWDVMDAGDDRLELRRLSADRDQGFPGELEVRASYRLQHDTLWLEFTAATDKPTLLSLSAHPYFNLSGGALPDIFGHQVTIPAEAFLPTDAVQIPTGELRPVAGTVFDFRTPSAIGARIRRADQQLLHGQGYDHYYVLPQPADGGPRLAARVRDPLSGRVLEVSTTQPGTQLYTGNQLNGSFAGRGGVIYRQSAALAIEPQGFPDAPHHPNFPSTILQPDDTYRAAIGYRFTTG